MLVSGPAMVATGTYGPKGFAPEISVPQGAEEADGIEGVTRVARHQIGHGIDFVKIYADYRWGPNGEARPTFSVEEIAAHRRGGEEQRPLRGRARRHRRRHAPRGHRRRRDHRSRRRRHARGVGADEGEGRHLLPDAGAPRRHRAVRRAGRRARSPSRRGCSEKRDTFQAAMKAGVQLCFGGDVGVFPHGDNVRELELMVAAGCHAGRGDAHRHLGQRRHVPPRRPARPGEARAARRSHRRRGRPDARAGGAAARALRDEGRPRLPPAVVRPETT